MSDKITLPNLNGDTKMPPITLEVKQALFPTQDEVIRALSTTRFSDVYRRFWQFPLAYNPDEYATAAANQPVVITLPAIEQRHAIHTLTWSFDGAANATLTVTDAGIIVFKINVSRSAAGWDFHPFEPGKAQRNPNVPLVITLSAGGSGVIGTLFANVSRV